MYSPEMWEQLGSAVANSELPLEDAFGLLLDVNFQEISSTNLLDFHSF